MSAAIRPFERRDRDQLTALVNLHVAAVIPGVVLSVNTVLGQLEREPEETIVDPWVAERRCLVAERRDGIAAAVLIHRFRHDEDVSESYRGTGEFRWMVCRPDAIEDGARLIESALEQMRAWRVRSIGAECNFPALACYGIPDSLPHVRHLLRGAGFTEPTRTELVLAASCDALTGVTPRGYTVSRTLGLLGARFTVSRERAELGFIEVCDEPIGMARSSAAVRWADIGNLVVHDAENYAAVLSGLLSVAADWMLLGGVTRLIAYWAEDLDPMDELNALKRAGFQPLVRNARGLTHHL
jgi:hypothetical protein